MSVRNLLLPSLQLSSTLFSSTSFLFYLLIIYFEPVVIVTIHTLHMKMPDTGDSEEAFFAFYRYDPSMSAAVLFTLLFIGTTGYHAFQMFKTRTWFFIPFVIGGIFEIIGYIGRAMSSKETPDWTLGPYIVQTLFLLLAPALLAASVYVLLGRIILLLQAESHALLGRKWLTKIFVTGDVLSFLLQGAGGGIQSSGNLDNLKNGERIIVVGLFVQIFFFGFFHHHSKPFLLEDQEISHPTLLYTGNSLGQTPTCSLSDELLDHDPLRFPTGRIPSRK